MARKARPTHRKRDGRTYSDWAKDLSANGRPVPEVYHDGDVWCTGMMLNYRPTFSPALEPKEWGARWKKKDGYYQMPNLSRLLRRIKEYDSKAEFAQSATSRLEIDWDPEVADTRIELDAFGADKHPNMDRLYPYQQQAVHAAVFAPAQGLLLGMSPGLGKTPTSIIAADLLTQHVLDDPSSRVLVVAPLPLVSNWRKEIREWSADSSLEIVHGGVPTPTRDIRWTITNYDTPLERQKVEVLDAEGEGTGKYTTKQSGVLHEDWFFDWDVVIFDESILLKNRKSKRVKSLLGLSTSAKKTLLLSGSPTAHDNSDVWQQFAMIAPEWFTSFWRFAQEFCVVESSEYSDYEIKGSRHGISVREEYPELMFVRNQEQVLPDLPDYIYKDVELGLTKRQQKAHDDLLEEFLHELDIDPEIRVEAPVIIAQLVRLQQVTSNLANLRTTELEWPDESTKADYVCEEASNGEMEFPILIWTHHRHGAECLHERLLLLGSKKGNALSDKRVELVYGGSKAGSYHIEQFKEGEIDVLILGIQVGKYGHTLTNTKTVVAYDKTWDADAWFQMLHRVRRHGLKHRPIFHTLRCRGTVDDFVEMNLAGKFPTMADLTGADVSKILRSLGEDHV